MGVPLTCRFAGTVRLAVAGNGDRTVTRDVGGVDQHVRDSQPPQLGRQRIRVARAVHEPPTDTRAYFRGRCLEKYADEIAAASWDSVIFDLPGRESLQRVPTIDPLRGSRTHVGELIDRCDTAEQLFAALTR